MFYCIESDRNIYLKMTKENIILEVCAYTLESAIIAEHAGADRIELCENSSEGGTTPSYGNIKLAKSKLKIPINVMIRPRGGDFLYSDLEFEIMKQDIETCKTIRVNAVVFGILNTDGSVDAKRCKELVKIAKPMSSTFHRAFDRVNEPYQALEIIINCGFERILTSGLEVNAVNGAPLLAKLIEKANDKIIIMPGGGVRAENIIHLLKITKAKEFHSSAKTSLRSKMQYHNPKITMITDSENSETHIHSVNPQEIIGMKKNIVLNQQK